MTEIMGNSLEIPILSQRQRATTDPLLAPSFKSTSLDSSPENSVIFKNLRENSTVPRHRSGTTPPQLLVSASKSLPTPPASSSQETISEDCRIESLSSTTPNSTILQTFKLKEKTTEKTPTPKKEKAPLFDDDKVNESLTSIPEFLLKSPKLQKSAKNSPLLGNWAIDKSTLGIGQDECPICLEEIDPKDRNFLPCSHYFHNQCVSQCMSVIITNGCPLCRIPILSEEDRLTEELVRQLSLQESE